MDHETIHYELSEILLEPSVHILFSMTSDVPRFPSRDLEYSNCWSFTDDFPGLSMTCTDFVNLAKKRYNKANTCILNCTTYYSGLNVVSWSAVYKYQIKQRPPPLQVLQQW